MTLPLVFMFSGQGSQYRQMGRELYDRHVRFRTWMDYCDEIARPLIGVSLCEELYAQGDKSRPFDRLLHTNPALISVEYSLARVLMEAGARPARLLGYSLGEFTMAMVGGALDLEDGLRFVIDYARLMEEESPPARMLAVIDVPDLEQRYAGPLAGCEITARNFDRHLVVTGPVPQVALLQQALAADGVTHQPLSVNYGFHTAMIAPLEHKVLALARQAEFRPLRMPVVSCRDGSVLDADTDPATWPEHLWAVSRQPVAFDTTIRGLLQDGDHHFVDVGPSGTLSTFVKYLLPGGSASHGASAGASTHGDVINPFGRDLQTYGNALGRLGLTDAHLG